MVAWACSRVFLLAMLSWDIYCHPLAPASSHSSPHDFIRGVGPSKGVSKSGDVPKREPNYYQPSVEGEPGTSYSSGAFSVPVASGYRGSFSPSVEKSAPLPSQPGLHRELPWAAAPPSPSADRFSSSGPAPIPSNLSPPDSEFQPGEMSNFERSYEHGDYQTETEEQSFQPPPPPGSLVTAEPEGFISQPGASLPTGWYGYPYYYPYDYMFLTGQYPPGTITHFRSSFDHGSNYWNDADYVRDSAPLDSSAEQPIQTSPTDSVDPPSLQQSAQYVQSPVNAGYGRAEAGYPMEQWSGYFAAH